MSQADTASDAAPATEAEPLAIFDEFEDEGPLVGILIGSESDREAMEPAVKELDERGISNELLVLSAHSDPRGVAEYASTAALRGVRVIICGAGMAAALPGVVAAYTELPVIGVPLTSSKSVMGGLDALLSIAQMPPGVPVACVSVNGARNAAILAARILAQGGGYTGPPTATL
jgi:phosphoribosylaminoimidazole carboxylase PurE protein